MQNPIHLLHGSSGYKQLVILGVDAGSKTVVLSASTHKEEKADMTLWNDIVDLMSTRREFRRTRHNRKTRYRKARFNNCVHNKKKGWLVPSVEVKIQEHTTIISRICNILPVSKVVVETAEFDQQLLKAIQAGEKFPIGKDYQRGEMYGFYNAKQYVFWRDGYTCLCCRAQTVKEKEVKLHVHHLTSRKTGGNAPDNLLTICEACHEAYHRGLIVTVGKRQRKPTKDVVFMGIMRKTLISRLRQEL